MLSVSSIILFPLCSEPDNSSFCADSEESKRPLTCRQTETGRAWHYARAATSPRHYAPNPFGLVAAYPQSTEVTVLHSRILCQIIVFCVSFKNYQKRKEEITRTWTESVSKSMFFILLKGTPQYSMNCWDHKKKGPQNQSWMTCVIKYWTTQYVVSHNHLLCQEENLDQQDTNTRLSKWNCCLLQKKTIKGGYIYCPPLSPGSHYH